MKLFLKKRKTGVDANADYDIENGLFTVLKGSVTSDTVSTAPTFRSANSVRKLREKYVKDNIVIQNVIFNSSSSAANFVTGRSTNGLDKWVDEAGTPLKELIKHI